jgi:hypothetical protein
MMQQGEPSIIDLLETVPQIPKGYQVEIIGDIIARVFANQAYADSINFHTLQGAYGIGKSTVGALITLCHFYQFGYLIEDAGYLGNIVSGGYTQLTTVTLAKVREILAKSAFGRYFTYTERQTTLKRDPSKFIRHCVCNVANVDSFAGIHGGFYGYTFLYYDEGTAILDKAYEIGDTFMDKGNCTWIVTGNPTTTKGEFYRICNSNLWTHWKITRYDFYGDNDPWALRVLDEYGEDSDVYRVKVMAEFPMNSSNNVFSIFALNECKRRGKIIASSGRTEDVCGAVTIAVDPSRGEGGLCDHAVSVWDYRALRKIVTSRESQNSLVYMTAQVAAQYNTKKIWVDGGGCGCNLDKQIEIEVNSNMYRKRFIPVVGVDNSTKPTHNKFCFNKRAENIMEAARWVDTIGAFCPGEYVDELCSQLMQIEYDDRSEKVKMMPKEGKMDIADSFCLHFSDPTYLQRLQAQDSTALR